MKATLAVFLALFVLFFFMNRSSEYGKCPGRKHWNSRKKMCA